MKLLKWTAGEKQLCAAVDGEVVLAHLKDADPIVGIVVNCLSEDGYTVSTFHVEAEGVPMPIVVMTKDNPLMSFEIVSESAEAFYEHTVGGESFHLYKQLCAHQEWVFDSYLALHVAYWLAARYPGGSDGVDMLEITEYINALRNQFFAYVAAVRIES